MANKKNSNKTWVFGAVVGAVAGAAYALWKTPMSGDELRGKLASGPVNQNETAVSDTVHTPGVGGKILSKVEHTLAPIVGVELGKTANQNGSVATAQSQPVAKPAASAPAATSTGTETATSSEAPDTAAARATAATGSDSIRANRFAWGEPAPEVATEVAQPAATASPEVAAPVVPPAQPAAVTTPESTGSYGSESIRAKRYAWGDPAPENGTEANAAPSSQTTASGQSTAPITAASPVEAVSDTAGTPGANMRKFPKLGGLEN